MYGPVRPVTIAKFDVQYIEAGKHGKKLYYTKPL